MATSVDFQAVNEDDEDTQQTQPVVYSDPTYIANQQADPNTVLVGNGIEDDDDVEVVVIENPADNFRDILCIIISSICCCPLLPCLSWISMYYHQKATEAYWIGDYTTAALKQSVSVKFLIAQCLGSPILLILVFIFMGKELLEGLYSIELENGAE